MRIRPGLALAKGLFQRAILESPGSMRPLSTLEEAERAGEIVASNLAAMRRMSADNLLKKNDAIVPPVRRLTAPRALSILALGCGRGSPSAPTQNRTPTPAPAPVSMRYHVSGVATDDNGSPIANAEVAVEFEAGQSILISIDPDSSIAYDGEDWWAFDWVWERLHVRVADAGTLTIEARPEQGGTIPSLAVFCVYVTDNCRFDWVKAPAGSGTGSLSVKANSLFEFRVAIPSRMAPQRYEVATSLQR